MLLLALATVTTEHSIVPTNHRCTATTCAFTPEMFKHATALNTGTSAVYLYWSISQDNDEIAIGVDAHDTRGWVAVGISANGGMMGADIWRLSKDGGGNLKLDDMFVEGWVTPRLDAEQNLKLQGAQQADGRTSFWFTRKVRTCDGGGMRWATNWTSEDFDILGVGGDSNTNVNMIWATGSTHAFHYHGDGATRRGKYGQHIWNPAVATPNETLVAPGAAASCKGESGLTTHRLVNEPFEVDPTGITTLTVESYWVPPSGTWMLVNIRSVRDPAWEAWHHHTLIYACTNKPTPRPTAGERVPQDGCREIILLPGDVYSLPSSAPKLGLLIGDDSDVKGFRVQVHYDGLWTMQGKMTDPGVGYLIDVAPDDGVYTQIGSIVTGTLNLALPSLLPRGDERLHMWGSCTIPDDVPADGVNVLYNIFHMHLQGRQMWMAHIAGPAWGDDEGKELSELGRHNYYDWNFQGVGGFPPKGKKLFAGDTLIVHCRFDSTNSVNRAKHGGLDLQPNVITTFGDGTMDEMCFDFVTYYPRVPSLSTCFGLTGKGDHLAVAATPAKNPGLSDQFNAQLCPGLNQCANAARCFRSPTIGGTFCDAATGFQSCPTPIQQCSACFPHSECGQQTKPFTYRQKIQTPRTCAAGESASEVAGLKPSAYWSGLQVQQRGPGDAPTGATASKCTPATPPAPAPSPAPPPDSGKSEEMKDDDLKSDEKAGDDQPLVIGLSVAAAVVTVAITALCILYYWRRHRAAPGHC